jgi:hypothetical protein|tara:strand:+ start:79 stop:342 length:264 start_codon:yes stop_codon:yes gene_type:complete
LFSQINSTGPSALAAAELIATLLADPGALRHWQLMPAAVGIGGEKMSVMIGVNRYCDAAYELKEVGLYRKTVDQAESNFIQVHFLIL